MAKRSLRAQAKARRGSAPPGEAMTPMDLPQVRKRPQPAPSHGVPVSPAELDRLKEKARHTPPPGTAPAEDEDTSD